jgi:hypothetical protein
MGLGREGKQNQRRRDADLRFLPISLPLRDEGKPTSRETRKCGSSPKSAHKRTQPNDPAGMLEKLCSGYSSESALMMRSESKEMFDKEQRFQANIR